MKHRDGLKGQQLLAQGIALGLNGCPIPALKGQKRYSRAMPCDSSFALTGRVDGFYVSQGDALGYYLLAFQAVFLHHIFYQVIFLLLHNNGLRRISRI